MESRGTLRGLASDFEYTVRSSMLPGVLSTVGIWYSSLLTAWFYSVKSKHIRMSPFGFRTTTMGAHHSVGSSTDSMTSRSVKRVISFSNFPRMGKGTLLGENRGNAQQ